MDRKWGALFLFWILLLALTNVITVVSLTGKIGEMRSDIEVLKEFSHQNPPLQVKIDYSSPEGEELKMYMSTDNFSTGNAALDDSIREHVSSWRELHAVCDCTAPEISIRAYSDHADVEIRWEKTTEFFSVEM